MHGREELCTHQQVMPCNTKECNDQIQDAVHWIPGDHHHDRRKHGEEREEVEDVERHCVDAYLLWLSFFCCLNASTSAVCRFVTSTRSSTGSTSLSLPKINSSL